MCIRITNGFLQTYAYQFVHASSTKWILLLILNVGLLARREISFHEATPLLEVWDHF